MNELQAAHAELDAHKLALRQAKLELEETRGRYAALYDSIPVGCLTLDEIGRTLDINPAGAELLGRARAGLADTHFTSWLAEDEKPAFMRHLHQVFQSREPLTIDLRIRTPDGVLREMRLESRVMERPQRPPCCFSTLTDQGERRKAEDAARLTTCVMENAAEGVIVTDARRIILSVNPAFVKSTGYSAEEVIGLSPALLQSNRHDKSFYQEMWASLNTYGHWQGEVWNRNKNGEIYPEWLSINAVKDSRQNVTHYVGIFSDAHTQESILERLHYLAYYDGLTGLPNRLLFQDRLRVSLSHARRDKHLLAVMFIDLDRFKQINDSLGHKIGDKVLMSAAERMKGCLRDGDTLARLGGDEFTVILPAFFHLEDAANVARKILESCARPLYVEGHELSLTCSIGCSIFPADGEDAETLLNHADIAMYRIKQAGRNGYLRYAEEPMNAAGDGDS